MLSKESKEYKMLSKESKEYKMLSKEIARNIKCYPKR
jgi:hypothetical protein